MSAQCVHVEWEHPPADWMMPAAIAFDTAVRQVHSAENCRDTTDALIVHVRLFSASNRPDGCIGNRLQAKCDKNIELVSRPLAHWVPADAALKTKLGDWLLNRRRLATMVVLLTCCLALLETVSPGSERKDVPDPANPSRTVTAKSWSPVTAAITIILWLVFHFLLPHILCKGIASVCIWYFDWLVITLNAAALEVALLYEYHLLNPEETFIMLLFVLQSICHVLAHGAVAMVDAFMMSLRWKILILMIYVLTLGFWYVMNRYSNHWSEADVCFTNWYCSKPKSLYLLASANMQVFAWKLLLTYCTGSQYCLLRAVFSDRVSWSFLLWQTGTKFSLERQASYSIKSFKRQPEKPLKPGHLTACLGMLQIAERV